MLIWNFSHITVEENACPTVDHADFSSKMKDLSERLLGQFRERFQVAPRTGFRLSVKLHYQSKIFQPFLEFDPKLAWDAARKRCAADSPTSPLAPSTDLYNILVHLESEFENYKDFQRSLLKDEAEMFFDESEDLTTKSFISTSWLPSTNWIPCEKKINDTVCPFRISHSQLLKIKNGGSKLGNGFLLVKESSSDASSFLIVPQLKFQSSSAQIHTNEDMSLSIEFWDFLQQTIKIFHQDGCLPFMVNMNFGTWESRIHRNRNVSACHGHCHILVSKKAAKFYLLSKAPKMPSFYRQENIRDLEIDRVQRVKLLISRYRREEDRERYERQLEQLQEIHQAELARSEDKYSNLLNVISNLSKQSNQ